MNTSSNQLPGFHIRSNRFFTTARKSWSNNVDLVIIQSSDIVELWKMIDGVFIVTDDSS